MPSPVGKPTPNVLKDLWEKPTPGNKHSSDDMTTLADNLSPYNKPLPGDKHKLDDKHDW